MAIASTVRQRQVRSRVRAGKRLPLAALVLAVSAHTAVFAAPRLAPSGSEIPENILRMELYLDTPLNSPLDMRYVWLLDAAGSPIDGALLDVALPGRDGLSVSILMHPGRIKTGVGPNSSMGMALHEGQMVTLEVADPQLQGVTKKTWTVAPALRQRIDPQHWIVHAPASGSREPVRLEFGAGLDAGAAQLIAVAAAGRRLPGKSMLVNGETGWRFTPSSPWRSGSYAVRVHPAIEDPAGNRLCSAFEAAEQSAAECDADVSINFSVR